MTKAHLAELVLHYRSRGWRGPALAQRIEKHARLLRPLDPDAAEMLFNYVTHQFGAKARRVA